MQYKGSKAEKHSTMCSATESALAECLSKAVRSYEYMRSLKIRFVGIVKNPSRFS